MTAMKARRGISGEQMASMWSLEVQARVYQRRRAHVRAGDKNATVSADPALISHH